MQSTCMLAFLASCAAQHYVAPAGTQECPHLLTEAECAAVMQTEDPTYSGPGVGIDGLILDAGSDFFPYGCYTIVNFPSVGDAQWRYNPKTDSANTGGCAAAGGTAQARECYCGFAALTETYAAGSEAKPHEPGSKHH